MKNIVVIGGGTMGNGIAHTAAASGFNVTLIDVGQEILDRAMTTISANLQRGVDKGKMSADEKPAVLGRIRQTTNMDAPRDGDIAIEAIIENLAAKTQLFEKLDKLTKPECILASRCRDARSDRWCDEARHEPPDGSADSRRLHRPREVLRLPRVVESFRAA